MKRRDLFTAAAGAMTGCAVSRSEVRFETAELDHLFGRLDSGLASVGNPFQEIAPRARFQESERAFVESTLRSLLLTAAYHELPATHRRDPRLTSRFEAHQNDFDLGLRGSRAILGMSAAERVTVQRAIRRNPTLASEVADVLGQHARLREVGGAERLELRRMAQQCAWRIQNQPLSLIAEGTLERMRRVEARLGAGAVQLRESVGGTYDLRSKQKKAAATTEAKPKAKPKPKPATKTSTISYDLGTRNPADLRGKKFVTTGLITMGAGFNLVGAGVALPFATKFNSELANILSFVMCGVGGVSFVIGLILLIYGGVIRAKSPDYLEDEDAYYEEDEWY